MSSSFEDLEVWKISCKLMVKIYKLLKNCREYSIKEQIFRAGISIPSNIAEGSERSSIKDFKRFINYATGSAAELRTQIYIAQKIEILSKKETKEIIEELKIISKMLQKLNASLKEWIYYRTVNRKL